MSERICLSIQLTEANAALGKRQRDTFWGIPRLAFEMLDDGLLFVQLALPPLERPMPNTVRRPHFSPAACLPTPALTARYETAVTNGAMV